MLSLLKNGHDWGLNDTDGRGPLSLAVENGPAAVVEPLLAKGGVDPDSKDNLGQTPLSLAGGNGHKEVVELLLANDSRSGL